MKYQADPILCHGDIGVPMMKILASIRSSQAASQAVPPFPNPTITGRARVERVLLLCPRKLTSNLFGRGTLLGRETGARVCGLCIGRASKEPGQFGSFSLELQLFQETGALELAQAPRGL